MVKRWAVVGLIGYNCSIFSWLYWPYGKPGNNPIKNRFFIKNNDVLSGLGDGRYSIKNWRNLSYYVNLSRVGGWKWNLSMMAIK